MSDFQSRLREIARSHGLGDEVVRAIEILHAASVRPAPTMRISREENVPTSSSSASSANLARYTDGDLIGAGGFGEVRATWDHHVERQVARKIQHLTRSSPEDVASFRAEIMITAALQHPGVVPIYDWGELPDGRIWFTMKQIHGDTIEKRIAALHILRGEEHGRALRRLLDDFRRLCEPIAYAHRHGIIHRDLSPRNLMIGQLGEVSVMDWGLARRLSRQTSALGAASSTLHESHGDASETVRRTRVAGTPYYMSPEQAHGDLDAMGPASDVYSLGAVLYEILAGRPPYSSGSVRDDSPEQILARVKNTSPGPIDQVARSETPKGLHELCAKAMMRSPEERYPDAGVLMEAVRDWLDGADRRGRALSIVHEASTRHLPRIKAAREEASALRTRSREILDKLRSWDRAQDKAEGWSLADEAQTLEQEAMREEIQWTQALRSALHEVPELDEAHRALAEHYAQSLLLAETAHDAAAVTSFAVLLGDHAKRLMPEERSRYEKLLLGHGMFSVDAYPPGTSVVIRPYEPVHRYLQTKDEKAIVRQAPVHELLLPHGSYLVTLSASGCHEVRYPLLIEREKHWSGVRPGEDRPRPVRLPREGELGPDDVFVPGGWFISGGDPRAGEGMPERRVWVDDFVIRKHPVTNAELLEMLNALVYEGRAAEARRHCPILSPGATNTPVDPLAYEVDPVTGVYSLRDPESQRARPAVFVDWHTAVSYSAYLARKTGLAWRLPTEMEWEKAARGVDGRFMPWGDQVEPTWACVSGSHPRMKGLMPVHEYPTDVSPYGVRGMAGNVRDWCIERWCLDGTRVQNGIAQVDPASPEDSSLRPMRGGAWISVGDLSRLGVRYAEEPDKRHGVLGFRLARSLIW